MPKSYEPKYWNWSFTKEDECVPVAELTLEQLQQALCECLELISKIIKRQNQEAELLRDWELD